MFNLKTGSNRYITGRKRGIDVPSTSSQYAEEDNNDLSLDTNKRRKFGNFHGNGYGYDPNCKPVIYKKLIFYLQVYD